MDKTHTTITRPRVPTITMTYSVHLCTTPSHLLSALQVRLRVFASEQGFPIDTEIDSYDSASAHFILVDDDEPERALGTVRWVPYPVDMALRGKIPTPPEPVPTTMDEALSYPLPLGEPLTIPDLTESFLTAGSAKLGRLALDSSLRGKGLGARLVVESERWIREIIQTQLQPGHTASVGMKLHSQMQVIQFYQRLGYTPSGEPFDEDGAPHMLCSKTIEVSG